MLKDVLDYDISVACIHNISDRAKQSASQINTNQDLCAVTLAAHDELFHHNKPVLAGVDINSLYCYLLSQEDQRDTDTWAVHFMDLQQQGFNPERVIGDDGDGLRAAHNLIFPAVPFDYDNFHLTQLLMNTRLFFRNRYKTCISDLIKIEEQMERAKTKGNPNHCSRKLGEARKNEEEMLNITQTIDILVSWMEHDVLNKAGPEPLVRKELYDFIIEEFENLNSRSRPYFFLRRDIGHGYLDLLRFSLNHSPFDRSSNPKRIGKSPAEILYGESHPHWLEMLGYTRFKRAA